MGSWNIKETDQVCIFKIKTTWDGEENVGDDDYDERERYWKVKRKRDECVCVQSNGSETAVCTKKKSNELVCWSGSVG